MQASQAKFSHIQIRHIDNSARLIQECTDLICIPICNIFNQSISQGIFLNEWKRAKVTPLFKQGGQDNLNINNY